jgi:hypothetical protein
MVKVTSPLQSLSASGTIAKGLTFSERKSGSQVRWQRKQKDKITVLRTAQRANFNIALAMWPFVDIGICECGYVLCGGKDINIMLLPKSNRAPQFARFVSDVLTFYL